MYFFLWYLICGEPMVSSFYSSFFPMIRHQSKTQLRFSQENYNHSYKRHYPFSSEYFENYIKRLNSKNISLQTQEILNEETYFDRIRKNNTYEFIIMIDGDEGDLESSGLEHLFPPQGNMEERRARTRLDPKYYFNLEQKINTEKTSENFEIVKNMSTRFDQIGGYSLVKSELLQCMDILQNYSKYAAFNVRIPKGLILEGPPGNGKTLLAKGFAGECNSSFIAVSGSEFQEKYVGIGSARVKELFELAKKNKPCVIFIDEIDAVGRKRSSDSDTSGGERDNTLNQLLVQMDGFYNSDGIFLIGATNRADLLDPALIRPGRIDKRIFIGMPDAFTREAVLKIHIDGKPHDDSVVIEDLVDLTNGLSAAQLENLLNEAMLYAIRDGRISFTQLDIETVMNRIMVGWQPTDHQFTKDMLERISIHEMGHAMIGLLMRQHSKMTKIVINLSSPNTPGYTVFEGSTTSLYTRDSLFEHLMILLAGRIAEEIFYNVSVTTGAINDFEEALKLAEKMITYYGMGKNIIYPSSSEKYKEEIDNEVTALIKDAYRVAYFIIRNCRKVIADGAILLQNNKILRRDELLQLITSKYPEVMDLYQG
jgi:cell division protease FtsH